jgi:pimeloyl-ACP methyl ester carboxylesterase
MRLDVGGRDALVHAGGGALPEGGHVVVLLHGAGNDHTVWRYQTRLLAGLGVPVVAPDLPGHGGSDGPPPSGIEAAAGWVGALLDALGATSAAVAGHSMGSLIALAAAAADPGRIRRIALVATSPRMAVHPDLQAAADARRTAAVDMVVGWSHTAASRFGGHRQAGVWTTAQTRRLNERNLGVLGAGLSACAAFDGRAAAARVAAADPPVQAIVISGERDLMTPASGGAEVAALLGAAHTVVPDGSHVSLYDHPDAVNAVLVPFLQG